MKMERSFTIDDAGRSATQARITELALRPPRTGRIDIGAADVPKDGSFWSYQTEVLCITRAVIKRNGEGLIQRFLKINGVYCIEWKSALRRPGLPYLAGAYSA